MGRSSHPVSAQIDKPESCRPGVSPGGDTTANAQVLALVRALARQTARAMWAAALARGDATLQRDTSVAPPSNTSIGGPDGAH